MKYIEWIVTGILGVVAWIMRQPRMQRWLINVGGKWLIRKILKQTRDYRATFMNEDDELRLVEEVITDIVTLSSKLAELGFDIKPKKLDSPLTKRRKRKYDQKRIKQTWKKGQDKMKSRDKQMRMTLKNSGMIFLIGILSIVLLTPAVNAVEAVSSEEITSDLEWFPKAPRTGILFDVEPTKSDDWSEHSHVSISIIGWQGLLYLDVGLVDFEQIETSGDHWWTTLNPSAGVTVDIVQAAERWPLIEPYAARVPDYVYVSGGYYVRMEHPHHGGLFFSFGLSW